MTQQEFYVRKNTSVEWIEAMKKRISNYEVNVRKTNEERFEIARDILNKLNETGCTLTVMAKNLGKSVSWVWIMSKLAWNSNFREVVDEMQLSFDRARKFVSEEDPDVLRRELGKLKKAPFFSLSLLEKCKRAINQIYSCYRYERDEDGSQLRLSKFIEDNRPNMLDMFRFWFKNDPKAPDEVLDLLFSVLPDEK